MLEMQNNYVHDKFTCEETLPPLEEDQMTCWFEQPWLNITNDEYLTIMTWSYGVPYFAYEANHIEEVYYTYDGGNDRYCYSCAHQRSTAEYKIEKWHGCDFARGEDLIDELQCLSRWCTNCTTTSLFYLENYPWQGHNARHAWCASDLLETYHKVDGRWLSTAN